MKTDNPQAFPTSSAYGTVATGMSLRDYFAAKAMQAVLREPEMKGLGVDPNWDNNNSNFHRLAKCSYNIADAMLEVRNSNKEGLTN